jgi:GNAT superfamily N-acetyltransferase
MASRPRVSILYREHHAAVAHVLGRAFVDDPLIGAILPPGLPPPDRVRRMSALFTTMLAEHHGIRQPLVGVIENGRVIAAAIVENLSTPTPALKEIRHGLLALPRTMRALGVAGTRRALATHAMLKSNRPAERHIYLNVLGVDPDFHGRGCGSAIMHWLHDQTIDRPDLAGTYLETARESNVGYYERFGYQLIGEINPIGVRTWLMFRHRSV